jgi:hypothetical protein
MCAFDFLVREVLLLHVSIVALTISWVLGSEGLFAWLSSSAFHASTLFLFLRFLYSLIIRQGCKSGYDIFFSQLVCSVAFGIGPQSCGPTRETCLISSQSASYLSVFLYKRRTSQVHCSFLEFGQGFD